jgi:hypothetical protein
MSNKINLVENAIARIEENTTKRQMEAAKLYFAAKEGDVRARVTLQEGISTSDIPTLLQPAINVEFLSKYAVQPTVWNSIADEKQIEFGTEYKFGNFTVDASAVKDVDGSTHTVGGLPVVPEYAEYPAVKFTTSSSSITLNNKKGVRARLSWEALRKSGNFDLINEFTSYFAVAAAREEDFVLAKQFVTAGGAAASAWSGKGISGNPALGGDVNTALEALGNAKQASRLFKVDGNPIAVNQWKLVYGTGLSATVDKLFALQGVSQRDTITGGSIDYAVNPGVYTGGIAPIEFPALDTVSGGTTDNFWFLVPVNTVRPNFHEFFVTGERTPLITIKDSGHMSLAGGEVPVREGSFDEDDIQTRVRHLVEAGTMNSDGFVYSTGAGS